MASKGFLLAFAAVFLLAAVQVDALMVPHPQRPHVSIGNASATFVANRLLKTGKYNFLLEAIEGLGLTQPLVTYLDSKKARLTLFAPTDAAFLAAPTLKNLNATQMAELLLFHAVPQFVSARAARRAKIGKTFSTFAFSNFLQKKSTRPLKFASTTTPAKKAAKVIAPNVVIFRRKVVVHGINKVLIPTNLMAYL